MFLFSNCTTSGGPVLVMVFLIFWLTWCIYCNTIYHTATVFVLREAKYQARLRVRSSRQSFSQAPGKPVQPRPPYCLPRPFSRKINPQNQKAPTPRGPNLFPSAWVRLRSESPGGSFPAPDRFLFLLSTASPAARSFP